MRWEKVEKGCGVNDFIKELKKNKHKTSLYKHE